MTDKYCVVAIDSPTLNTICSQALSAAGYTVHSVSSGFDALTMVHQLQPAAAVLSADLSDITGYTLCRLIKKTPATANTQVILCNMEESSITQYWAENNEADGFFVPEFGNIQSLVDMVNDLVSDVAVSAEQTSSEPVSVPENQSLPQLLKDSISAMDHDLFNLLLVQNAWSATGSFSIEDLVSRMSQDIRGIIPYDVLGIIVYDMNLTQYYQRSSRLSDEEFLDFMQVCRTDAESRALGISKFNWEQSRVEQSVFYTSGQFDTIKCYEGFPTKPSENLVFSVHLGSFSENVFRIRNTQRLATLITVYEKLIAQELSYHKAQLAESNMRRAFSRFVPDSIIEEVIAGGAETKQSVGEKRKVAVMMTDIRNFTSISELNAPEAVVAFLNTFFATMGRIIKKHGGIIDKFMGDCIMALFGAPESYPDNANRAANAAIEMHQAVKDIPISLTLPDGLNFSIGTGIHYGEAIVGSIGSDDKREYTVIGDSVNISSRVEGLTKLYGEPVIITESVRADLRDGQVYRHLDNVRVKGKSVAVPIYALAITEQSMPEESAWLENYAKGMHQYTMGNFTTAEQYFFKAHDYNPADKATMLMLGRCEEFIENPPDDWDGSIALVTK